jgi:hypothetical protein
MIDWNSDKPLKTKKEKLEVLDAALAPHLKTPDEEKKYRCPVCGSHDWGSVPGIIFCGKGCCKGSTDPEYIAEAAAKGYRVYTMAEWRNPEYPWPKSKPLTPQEPSLWTGALLSRWFGRVWRKLWAR